MGNFSCQFVSVKLSVYVVVSYYACLLYTSTQLIRNLTVVKTRAWGSPSLNSSYEKWWLNDTSSWRMRRNKRKLWWQQHLVGLWTEKLHNIRYKSHENILLLEIHLPCDWPRPVSYTHLDVYKRQVQHIPQLSTLFRHTMY